jgi:putative intracellular protease/amidase
MNRHWLDAIAVIAMLLSVSIPARSADAPKVLMIVRDGSRDLELMLSQEVGVMKRMLEESGFKVEVATESGEPMRAGSVEMSADFKVSEAVASNYAGVALPCMAPAPEYSVSPAELAIVKEFVEQGKPILAARGSVAVLASAGGLEGKKYAFASEVDPKARLEFAGGQYQGTGVVRDGNVSTSGVCPLAAKSSALPDGTEEVTRNFIESLGRKN